MEYNKLFTIAIPTYNRANYLDLCLRQIYNQILGKEELIELLVSNNASTDNTDDIIQKYIKMGLKFTYFKNRENIGSDRNFLLCFQKSSGKFLLLLSDDDVLVDNSIEKILKILKKVEEKECGLVYLNAYGYYKDFKLEKPEQNNPKTLVYEDTYQFVKKVNYFITFISGNIINKSLFNKRIKFNNFFLGSSLTQTIWAFSVIFNSKINIFVDEYLLSSKLKNTRNYKFCNVFGKNFNEIFRYSVNIGVDKKYFKFLNRRLLKNHFPIYLYMIKYQKTEFEREDLWGVLYPIYKYNLYFWIFTAPVIKSYILYLISKKITEILVVIKHIIQQ